MNCLFRQSYQHLWDPPQTNELTAPQSRLDRLAQASRGEPVGLLMLSLRTRPKPKHIGHLSEIAP